MDPASGTANANPRRKRLTSAVAAVCLALSLLSFTIVLGQSTGPRHEEGKPAWTQHANWDASDVLRFSFLENVVLLTGNDMTAQAVLENVVPQSTALLVVTHGPNHPARRDVDTPFLSVGPGVQLPVGAINAAASMLEEALGRNLFAMRVEAADFSTYVDKSRSLRPYVIWEVGSGLLLVDQQLVQQYWSQPKVHHMTGLLADKVFSSAAVALMNTAQLKVSQLGLSSLQHLLIPVVPAAVAAAFAAAPPLWFCVLCPAVLGLLAPLLINIGLNQLAGYICLHYNLPDDQCFDLLLGALGLGFVLALASAIPIFYVCRLPQCANRQTTELQPAIVGKAAAGSSHADGVFAAGRNKWWIMSLMGGNLIPTQKA